MVLLTQRNVTTCGNAHKAQSLSEYILIGAVLGILGLAGVVGFNGGLHAIFNQLQASLLSAASPVVPNQTNQQIAYALAMPPMPQPTSAPTTPPVEASYTLQLQTLNTLIANMDPTNLPEVSGSNSTLDITGRVSLANLLIQHAVALEATKTSNVGLNVSELVFQARKLALTQYSLAADLLGGGVRNVYDDQALVLANELLVTHPNDGLINYLKNWVSNDIHASQGYEAEYDQMNKEVVQDYKTAYQPLLSAIEQLNIQTQQAQTVKDKGNAIKNNGGANGNAHQNEQDANAINACQNATCN
jgi:hypothetical protein